ncbi:hypothetical protein FDE82_02935 [Clostridium botulinum]|nr:hypothetical protein [Clostridium botulinum]
MDTKKYKEILDYLHSKVEIAYLNGDIGTVKHLCGAAGEKIPNGLYIKDCEWIISYLIICIKYDSDYDFVKKIYDTKISNYDNNFKVLFDFIFEILEPRISSEIIKKHFDNIIQIDVKNFEDRLYNAILIEKVIELFWYLNDKEYCWEKICTNFIEEFNRENKCMLKESIKLLNKRLIVQYKIINDRTENIPQLVDKIYHENLILNMLAKGWWYFFNGEWILLDTIIPEMVKLISFESEYFMSLQGLINMTRQQRELASSKYSNDIYSGIYRYNRIQLEKPLAIYNFERIVQIEKLNSQIKIKPNNAGYNRSRMYRLIIVTYLDTLKYWDLGSYFDVINNQAEFALSLSFYFDKFGSYCGMIDWADNTVILFIKSMQNNILKKDEFRILIGIIELEKPELLNKVIEYILFKSNRLEWHLCVEWLELLGDSIPKKYVSNIINWTITYNKYKETQKHGFNANEFNYLKNIIENFTLTMEQWEELYGMIDLLFSTPFYWRICTELLESILKRVNIDKCMDLFSVIKKYSVNKNDKNYVIGYIYNTSIKRQDVREFGISMLKEIYLKTKDEEYKKYYTLLENEQRNIEFAVIVKKLEQHIENFQNVVNTPGQYIRYYNISDEYANINWSIADNEILETMFDMIKDFIVNENKRLYEDYFFELLQILREIALNTNEIFKQKVINFIIYLLKQDYITKRDSFINNDYPLQTFRMTSNINNKQRYAYLILIAEFIHFVDNKEDRIYLLNWCLGELLTSEVDLLYYYTYIFSYLFIKGTEEQKGIAFTGLMMLYTIISKSSTKTDAEMMKFLRAIEHIFNHKHYFNNTDMIDEISKKKNSSFYKILLNILNLAYKSFNYLARKECAKIILMLSEKNIFLEDIKNIKKELQSDTRASIRGIFTNDK